MPSAHLVLYGSLWGDGSPSTHWVTVTKNGIAPLKRTLRLFKFVLLTLMVLVLLLLAWGSLLHWLN